MTIPFHSTKVTDRGQTLPPLPLALTPDFVQEAPAVSTQQETVVLEISEEPRGHTMLFDAEYLARLRTGDQAMEKHFDHHFRRLLRLKLWERFSKEQQQELIAEVMTAVEHRVAQGEPTDAGELPRLVYKTCMVLEKMRTPVSSPIQLNQVTREQLRKLLTQRRLNFAGKERL
jgi:hypothetical protein